MQPDAIHFCIRVLRSRCRCTVACLHLSLRVGDAPSWKLRILAHWQDCSFWLQNFWNLAPTETELQSAGHRQDTSEERPVCAHRRDLGNKDDTKEKSLCRNLERDLQRSTSSRCCCCR